MNKVIIIRNLDEAENKAINILKRETNTKTAAKAIRRGIISYTKMAETNERLRAELNDAREIISRVKKQLNKQMCYGEK